ncbi:MAG TPA: fluoride efflux transporter CrcB [Thermoleophilaceae bacterium]
MTVFVWLGVGVLGGAGALARFLLDGYVGEHLGGGFPWGTFAVNVSGAFALGLVTGLALHGDALVLAGGAALGSYTTFSTWMLESDRLVEAGQTLAAVMNVVLTLLVGLGAAELGRLLGGAL